MNLKLPSLLVSDIRLCHLLRVKHICVIYPLKIVTYRHFCNLFLNSPKFKGKPSQHRTRNMSENMNSQNLFIGKEDRYDGITVFSNHESCEEKHFEEKLKNSLILWRTNKKQGIWFKVHLAESAWVPILVRNGFKYHHAKEDYVMLYLWLPTTESNNIPPYANTLIGVGAVVVNDRDQVLVVREKYFYKVPMWKLPGGYVEPGENLVDAAIREVSEETGIEAKFESILSFRHTHYGMFGCSDIYFIVSLKALTDNITKCEREIAECKWMDIDEYLQHPNIHELNRFFVQKLVDYQKQKIQIDCEHGIHQLLQKPYTVYSVKIDKESDQKEVLNNGSVEETTST